MLWIARLDFWPRSQTRNRPPQSDRTAVMDLADRLTGCRSIGGRASFDRRPVNFLTEVLFGGNQRTRLTNLKFLFWGNQKYLRLRVAAFDSFCYPMRAYSTQYSLAVCFGFFLPFFHLTFSHFLSFFVANFLSFLDRLARVGLDLYAGGSWVTRQLYVPHRARHFSISATQGSTYGSGSAVQVGRQPLREGFLCAFRSAVPPLTQAGFAEGCVSERTSCGHISAPVARAFCSVKKEKRKGSRHKAAHTQNQST